jgi:hypothetical protein
MRQRAISLRLILVTGLPALTVAAGSQVAMARSGRPPCDKIRAAVTAGRTIDQITKEFDTDAEQVTKCLQTRGRRRKSTAAGKQTRTKTKKKGEQTTLDVKQHGRETPEESKPPATPPRSRRPPSHPFGSRAAP